MGALRTLQDLTQVPLYFLAAAALSLWFTRICIVVLPYCGMLDVPHGRHQHDHAVPRGGGLAVIGAFSLVMLAYLFVNATPGRAWYLHPWIVQFAPPTLAITLLGVLDDRFNLRSWYKLFGHILIGIYFFCVGVEFNNFLGWEFPWFIALPVTLCWFIGCINAFNLIDGMDGVATGLAMIAAFAMSVWQFLMHESAYSVVCTIVFCGACLGFLRYNFAPARIFLGDTGSMFIGMFFAYFSIEQSVKAMTLTSLAVPLLAMGVPLFDAFLAIIRRLYRRYVKKMTDVGIMTGDRDHLHHRLFARFRNQRKTAYMLYSVAILMVAGGIMAALLNDVLRTLSFAILLAVIFMVVRFATIEFYDAAELISEGIHIPHKNMLLTAFHPVLDVLLLTTAYVLCCLLFQRDLDFLPTSLKQAFCYIAPYPVVLGLGGIYRTYWMRAGIARYYKLVLLLMLASLIGLMMALGFILVEYGMDRDQIARMREFFTAYALMGCVLILLERFLLHFMESFGYRQLAGNVADGRMPRKNILIYGGGLNCRLLLTMLSCSSNQNQMRNVIGILDDNSSLRGLNVYGVDVIGNIEELPELRKKYHFDEIVIALRNVTPAARKKLMEFGRAHGVVIREFLYNVAVCGEFVQSEDD